MLRIIELTYTVPLDEVEKYLVDHRNFLQKYYDEGYFIASGPREPKDGGMILAVGEIDFLNTVIRQDPFYKNQIAVYRIISFNPVKKSKDFEVLLQKMQTGSLL